MMKSNLRIYIIYLKFIFFFCIIIITKNMEEKNEEIRSFI